jgi:hypothetical protein
MHGERLIFRNTGYGKGEAERLLLFSFPQIRPTAANMNAGGKFPAGIPNRPSHAMKVVLLKRMNTSMTSNVTASREIPPGHVLLSEGVSSERDFPYLRIVNQ